VSGFVASTMASRTATLLRYVWREVMSLASYLAAPPRGSAHADVTLVQLFIAVRVVKRRAQCPR
jgi:hypothetical protein